MYKSIIPIFLFLMIVVSIVSCRKDDIYNGNETIIPEPEVYVQGSVSGLVVNENNDAVINAVITIGNESTQTDVNGYFFFTDIEINERGSYLTALKDGYFHNSSFITSKLKGENFINLVLIRKVLSGTFNAIEGGTVSLAGGAEITFQETSLVSADGNNFTGQAQVLAKWLDPTSPDLLKMMPGDLRAIDQNQMNRQLITYGMIGVEIKTASGESLYIDAGKEATISLPIPASLLSGAPATIPLWHFDETSGYWIEEGSAELTNGKYVGNVSHFSFWNVDVPRPLIFLDGYLIERGFGLEKVAVKITTLEDGITAVGYTDLDGFYSGYVPQGELLKLSVCDECGNVVYSEEIGSFEEDTSLPDINVNLVEGQYVSLTGSLVDCNGDPVTQGYIVVRSEQLVTILDVGSNGEFEGNIFVCENVNINIFGFDVMNERSTKTYTVEVDDMQMIDAGVLLACEDFEDEYIIYSMFNTTFIMTEPDPKAAINAHFGSLGIEGEDSNLDENEICYFGIPDFIGVGEYKPEYFAVQGLVEGFKVRLECINCPDLIVNITAVGGPGEYIKGTFEGVALDINSVNHPVSGEFSILL